MGIELRPGWYESKNGNPTRVFQDTRFTVIPYPEDRSRYTHVVGGIIGAYETSYETSLQAQMGAEETYQRYRSEGVLMSSDRAWFNTQGYNYGKQSKRSASFTEQYNRTRKPGDVSPASFAVRIDADDATKAGRFIKSVRGAPLVITATEVV